jgi:hypothetical protein
MVNSPLSAAGISSIALALAVFFVWAVGRATPSGDARQRRRRRVVAAVGATAWLVTLGALAHSGVLARFDVKPPPVMLAIGASVALAVGLGLSRVGAELATLPLPILIGWQAFRLPLELTMHHAASVGLMPTVMSYSGRNYDIVSGLGACVLALALTRFRVPRAVVLAWQVVASALLLNVMAVAMAATPLFRAFGDEQLNTWVAYFPYIWLPSVMVLSALLGHIVISRHLLATHHRNADASTLQTTNAG